MSQFTEQGRDPRVTLPSRQSRHGLCPCCRRRLVLTFHHLIPRKLHRRARFRKRYGREELSLGMYICRDCHDGIHRTYTEMELARSKATPDALLTDPDLARHFAWLSRQRRKTG